MPEVKQGCAPSECGTKPACHGCSLNKQAPQPVKDPPQVGRVVGVVSGKGGVGKSLVSGALAAAFARAGLRVGIMDADITGPSIPHMFGVHEKAIGDGEKIFPAVTKGGIQLVSINLMLEEDDAPVVWRGPVIAGCVKQFWEDVAWDQVDVMVIDMPPGTGDVPLTVFQNIPLDGVIVVATPQDLVGMIVRKAVNMAQMMEIPVLGLVENMAYVACPDCGKRIALFGPSHIAEQASALGIPVLAQLPISPENAALCDEGRAEEISLPAIDEAAAFLMGSLDLKL